MHNATMNVPCLFLFLWVPPLWNLPHWLVETEQQRTTTVPPLSETIEKVAAAVRPDISIREASGQKIGSLVTKKTLKENNDGVFFFLQNYVWRVPKRLLHRAWTTRVTNRLREHKADLRHLRLSNVWSFSISWKYRVSKVSLSPPF